ncbi:MAG: ATP-binding protein [Nitrospirales bacterium]|nr:response regulator [Nitrospira sp.]MDR4502317.1 ATP-binding protein [Nitrospirales bacterium]
MSCPESPQEFEQAYRQQLFMNQALLKALSVGVCLIDEAGAIVSLNHAGSRLLGWSESSVKGKPAHDLWECVLPESDRERPACPLHICQETQSPIWSPSVRLRTRQGEWLWVELSCLAMTEMGGVGTMITFRDLRTEIQLREESRQLSSIPEESPFPMIEVDASGNLLYANPVMTRLMQESGIGNSGFSEAFPAHFLSLIHDCLTTNTIRQNIEVNVGQNQYAWVFSPHPEAGLVRGFGMDISERKLAADKLTAFARRMECNNRELDQALIKAEAATKAKAAFLATMSHEIRTPLNGVIGMTEMLMDSTLTLEQREWTTLVRSSAEGLLTIVNDILDFSKIEAGKLQLEVVRFDVRLVLEDVLDVFADRAHKKGLDLAGYVHHMVPRYLHGDPNRLRQILTNFIGNAIKFTEHGHVLVKVTDVSAERNVGKDVRSEKDQEVQDKIPQPDDPWSSPGSSHSCSVHLRFSVEDTGIGIPEDAQQRLFEAFSQADVSTTRKYGGTGLGLAISRQLVELMEGSVGVNTTDGGGATFWCHIPFISEPDDRQEQAMVVQFSEERVLSVGCLPATASALHGVFREWSVKWEATTDCAKAHVWLREAAVKGQGFSILFVDACIPEPYQQTFILAVKADPLLHHLRVVLLANIGVGVLRHQDEGCEIDACLNKPVRRSSLLRCLSGMAESDQDQPSGMTVESSAYADRPDHQHIQVLQSPGLAQGPKVLVVEDNAVNQKVLTWALKKMGCLVTLAGNGRVALDVSCGEEFDLIFMDWQMPEMDGLETTRAMRIREVEDEEREAIHDQGNRRHVPIIGMTANAMKGDREQCLEAGMDDYLSKPVRAQDLRIMLEKWAPDFFSETPSSSRESSEELHDAITQEGPMAPSGMEESDSLSFPDTAPVYDLDHALRELEGDEKLLLSLVEIFLQTGPELMHAIHTAFEEQNYHELERQAHQLKGASGTLQAHEVSGASARVEKAARAKNLEALRNAFVELEHEFVQLCPVLEGLVARGIQASCESNRSVMSK